MNGRGLFLSILAAVGLGAAPAAAAEGTPVPGGAQRLVMPYSCALEQGVLTARPSPERPFEIVGPREERLFTTCDPPFSNNCRSFTIHKFDIACGLDRVPWHRVVAAIGRTTAGEASLSKGHIVLAREADAASGHAPSCTDRRTAAAGGECLPWRVRKPTERIVLPPGFAPLSEAGAQIIDGTVPSAYAATEIMTLGGPALSGSESYAVPQDEAGNEVSAGLRPVAATSLEAAPDRDHATDWTTSLSFSAAEESTPELVIATSSVSTSAAAASAAAPVPAPSVLPWIAALLGCLGLGAAVYLHRTRQVRFAAPDLTEAAQLAWDGLRSMRERTEEVVGTVRTRLASSGDEDQAPGGRPSDPALSSALLQLRAMLARTEAAVSTLSSAAVVREVMQTELSAIRSRLEDAERAAGRGSTPVMKLAAQFRQIARDIDRVQKITESAAQSLSQSAADPAKSK